MTAPRCSLAFNYPLQWSQSLVETLPKAGRQVCTLVEDFQFPKTFFE